MGSSSVASKLNSNDSESAALSPVKPERNLLAAVLARAICDAFGSAQCDRHEVRTARQWLFGRLTPKLPFSFAWVSLHLDLDPVSLQETLRQYEDDPEMVEERLNFLR
ncbi:MAG: hypothetical protein D6808_07640 [Candidatus Dadabacteria bacterium]|nr:MAG: hypothetical protein D6808_07640 [Candidatus Dadabacteria bacterium]